MSSFASPLCVLHACDIFSFLTCMIRSAGCLAMMFPLVWHLFFNSFFVLSCSCVRCARRRAENIGDARMISFSTSDCLFGRMICSCLADSIPLCRGWILFLSVCPCLCTIGRRADQDGCPGDGGSVRGQDLHGAAGVQGEDPHGRPLLEAPRRHQVSTNEEKGKVSHPK